MPWLAVEDWLDEHTCRIARFDEKGAAGRAGALSPITCAAGFADGSSLRSPAGEDIGPSERVT
jgi:hypothetical protein